MVKCSCKIKLKKYRARMAGYPGVMNDPNMQGVLRSKAFAVKAAADSASRADARYAVEQFHGRLADGFVVRTDSYVANAVEAKHKTLTKAAASAGGGR